MPILMLEKDVLAHPALAAVAQELFDTCKNEGSASRGIKHIAPNLFIGSERRGYFHYSRHRKILLVYAYTGSDEYFATVAAELLAHCERKGYQLNILSHRPIAAIGDVAFTATPFGVVQRILDLPSFTLEGGAMRRLRYQVGTFEKAGSCSVAEYRCGTDPAVDTDIARVIDSWCAGKTKVNPLVRSAREEILAGTLHERHRLFLTRVDGVLQNVVLISPLSDSDNGYLMDLEFYGPDMPRGGLEFAIVRIIEILVAEGRTMLSLGGTYGCRIEQSPNADAEVDQILDDLHKQEIFNDQGNFQFKNKFRPQAQSIFLCRKAGCGNPDSIIDIIMMIADPLRMQTSDVENHTVLSEQEPAAFTPRGDAESVPATDEADATAAAAADEKKNSAELSRHDDSLTALPQPRARLLAEAGFNPLLLSAEQVEFDLKTDSWAQLKLPAIESRMQRLHARLQSCTDAESSLREIFPFAHFVLADSGRSAEQALYRAWPNKGKVLQNLLFPTNLYHQIDNDFDPKELPSPVLFRIESDEAGKGELDLAALDAALAGDAAAIALVCIETCNNAAGGNPVSLQHLQQVKARLAPHAIPLLLDATRIVENARFQQRNDAAGAAQDLWQLVREMLACADVVVVSLAKDFGLGMGGLIATNDAALHRAARAAVEQAGSGLDLFERKLIALALRDRRFIENAVDRRMQAVRTVWQALKDCGAPVLQPAGGHCVLIDVKRIPAVAGFELPVASFLACLYLNTGIRAGAHSVGMQRRRETSHLVRLALPLGLEDSDVAQIAQRLAALFHDMTAIPELLPRKDAPASFGELATQYTLKHYHNVRAARVAADAPAPLSQAALHAEPVQAAPVQAESVQVAAADGEGINRGSITMQATPDTEARSTRRTCDIAVVGMAGRYPRAKNIDELWQNLKQGLDCIEELPADRYEQRLRYGPAAKYRGGFIADVDKFDSLFFNIPPKDAERLDPQERLFAEVAWETLEDAGYYPELLNRDEGGSNVGVYVGAVWATYQTVGVEEKHLGGTQAPSSFLWSIANRVSYGMNFSGPSLTIDTACSSSLTALYLACEAIYAGECNSAIVGGVNLDLHQSKWDINWSGGALSKDGVCRSFGHGANGYVAGEGVGAVYIKPLAQAVADGDHIYGVIKGIAVNHGGRTSGFVVPNPKAQTNLIRAALERAEVSAASIGYIEAHGTGTELGDPLEIAALNNAFDGQGVATHACAVGSLKTNIGHLEAAAGVASLSKVLLQMQHRQLVPSLHSAVLNEHIDFDTSPFRVQQQLQDWLPLQVDGLAQPLRAGISSFGAGGSNAHVILESYAGDAAAAESAADRETHIFPLSARTEAQLVDVATRLRDYLQQPDAVAPLRDIAFTLQCGRKPFEFRVALLARSRAELVERIGAFLAGKKHEGVVIGNVKNADVILKLMSRSEREQVIGLLSRRRDAGKVARLWAEGVLLDWRGINGASSGRRVSLPTYPFADKRHWVPVTAAGSVAALAARRGIHPLVDSNESTFERQLFKKTFHDGEFFIYDHRVMDVPTLPGVAYLELARKAGELAAGRPVRRLRNILWVSPIAVRDVPAEAWVELKPSHDAIQFEVFSDGDSGKKVLHSQGKILYASESELAAADEYVDLAAIRARCAKVMNGRDAYPLFKSFGLDLGPGFQSLQEVYRSDSETLGLLQLPPARLDDLQSLLLHPSLIDGALQAGVAAQLGGASSEMLVPFSIGEVEVIHPLQPRCWSYVTEMTDGRVENSRVSRKNVLILDDDGKILVRIREATGVPIAEVHKEPARKDEAGFARLFYAPEWEAAPLPALAVAEAPEQGDAILLFDRDDTLRELYRRQLAAAGSVQRVVLVRPAAQFARIDADTYAVDPANFDHFAQLIDAIVESKYTFRHIGFAWPLGGPVPALDEAAIGAALASGVRSLLPLCQALTKLKFDNKLQLVYLHASGDGELPVTHDAVAGFFRALHLEFPKVQCKTLELNGYDGNGDSVLAALRAEFRADAGDAVALRIVGGERQLRRLKLFDLAPAAADTATPYAPRARGVYLITGGAGGLGLIFAEFLARRYQARLLLTGRSAPSAEREAQFEQLRALGAEVVYIEADVSSNADVQRLVATGKQHFGEINGVIHSAGVLRDSYVRNKPAADFDAVLAPKVFGTVYLDEATRAEPLDFFVLFSSMAAVTGNAGQSDYGYANHFMDSFAFRREQQRGAGLRAGKALSLNWSLWADGGMRVDEQTEQMFTKTLGIKLLGTDTGIDAFVNGLSSNATQLAVLEGNQEKIEIAWGMRKKPQPVPAAAATVAAAPGTQQNMATLVQAELTRMAMEFLKLDAADISPDSVLLDLGFDSIGLTTYANEINDKYGVDVTPVLFFDYPSIQEVSKYLAAERSAEVARVHASAGGGTVAKSAAAPVVPVDSGQPQRISKGWDSRAYEAAPHAAAGRAAPVNRFDDMPIAIVGMSGVMPQSDNLDEFWQHLKNGDDLISVIPEDRWDWEEFYGDPFKEVNKSNSKWGGFMREVDKFDALFFGISKREAQMMDPQQRIFLETVWKAIEDSGHRVSDLSGTRTGLFVGVATNDYVDVMNRLNIGLDGYSASGNSHSVLANRVSFLLNLRGPSAPIDTACSSSLVALHRAIESIHTGSCDMAIVGGVQVMLSPAAYISFGMAGMLSSDGKCKTFDKRANGYVRGEGSGAILLKSLAKAEADGDHIYAVVRATAENHGGRVTTLTAPNSAAQAELLVDAYDKAQMDPATVGYIECHGTGTGLGDPIEIQALTKAFSELYKRHDHAPAVVPHVGLSSAKTNIGHLETAAGIAGILRVLLAIRHRQIPANVHFEEINPYINLAGTPFYIADKTRDWQSPQGRDGSVLPRRAGVSSFGFGGANAHIVLEEHLASAERVYNDTVGPQLVVLSAKTDDRLHAYAEAMLERAEADAPDLLDFAYTLQVGRDEMPERLAFVAATIDDVRGKLRAFLDGNAASGVSRGSSRARKDAPPIADAATVQALIEAQDLAALAAVWVNGADIDWRRLPRLRTPRRIALPTYPFARERCWIPGVEGFRRSDAATPAFTGATAAAAAPARTATVAATAAVATSAAPQTLYYRSVWQETPLAASAAAGMSAAPILLLAHGEALREQLRRRLGEQGRAVPAIVLVQPGDSFQALSADTYRLQPAQHADYAALFAALQTQGLRPRHIVHAWSGSESVLDADALRAGLDHGVGSLFALGQTLAGAAQADKAAAAPAFATNLFCLIPADAGQAQPQHAALASFVRSAALEIPQLSSKCIAIGVAVSSGMPDETAVDRLIAELADDARGNMEIRYTAQQRLVRSLQPWTPSVALPAAVRERGTYVITGGAGGLGLIVAKFLASQAKVNLALIGRSQLDAAQTAKLAELEALGAQVAYLRGDVGQRDAAQALLQQVRERFGSIHGIVHAAGVIRDAPIERKTVVDFDATCAPKLYGTIHLDQASQSDDLDFFVLFSSLAAELGSSGQCDYAYANGFQHHYAALRERLVAQQQRRGRTLAIDWPLWQDGGMQVERIKGIQLDAKTKAMLQESSGMYALDTDAGLAAFAAALLGGETQLLVMHGNPAKIDRVLGLAPAAAAPALRAPAHSAAAPRNDAEFVRRLRSDLLRIVAEVLLVSPQQIVADVNLSEYGLDSLGVANLFRRLNDSYALSLAPAVVFEYPTFDALSGYLASTHAAELRPFYADAFDATTVDVSEAVRPLADTGGTDIAAAPAASLVPVAIVGIAGVFPGADTPDELWQQILAGADLVSEIPPERWDWRAHHADSGAQRNTTAARWGGFLRNVDKFDAPFFGIGALEAALMDPQQRLFLQVAWNAIEDSGHRASELAGTRTGVFVGLGGFDYVELLRDADTEVVGYSATGMAHCVLPNRLSYLLDLRGPSEAIDTACSSSLVAIHRAAESVASGHCTAAIAGGTNVLLTPSLQLALGSAGMLAADGRCKTFDHRADGYVRGEGCAAVLLKRLDQAVADGDTIYAVVKGSGVNHGGRAMSLTAPNPNAQAELLVDVYRRAAVDAGQVGLIEAHGTGTAMGDAVELNGLKKAFRELGVATTARCAVGSIKTNIGHLEAASGVTSLIKTVLAMRHRKIPGVLHFEQLNPQIRLDDSPFHIARGTQDWTACSDAAGAALPLTAGISSLGFGGVNAHLVVQEYRASQALAANAPHAQKLARLIVLSAKTPEQLVARAGDLLAYLQASGNMAAAPLARIAATLQVGRENLRERLAFVVDSVADLAARLQAFVAGDGAIAAAYRSRGERDSDSVGLINRDADIKAMIVSKWLSSNDLGPLLELWTQGVDIDWLALYAGALPPRINLPTYPFARERHWVDTVAAADAAATESPAPARTAASRKPPSTARLAGLRSAADLAAQLIGEELARQLQIPAAQLPGDRNLLELGVTSLGIASLVREVNRRLELDLSPSLIFEYPTIARFAAYLGETCPSAIGRAMATAVLPEFGDGDTAAAAAADVPDGLGTPAEPVQRRESAREVLESIVWQDSATGDEYERMTF
ncbi:acyl transferase domain-containing protein [Tahibacter aquaticus]|uniref:Acyl transferase domain-containing protein n=2 Tax=Tahibacter aquaticus TaxID=520092 RepID=A0A4R6YZZ1_9GAMM|nr:acyl transferase domain-containing protein [Tahibacter aquaticus]